MRLIRSVNLAMVAIIILVIVTQPWTGVDLVDRAYDALGVAAAVSLAFTTLYVTRSRWRQFAAGRSLLYVSVMLSGTLTLVSVARFFGTDYPGRPVLLFAFFTGMLIVLVNLLLTLLRIQRAKATGELPPGEVERAPRYWPSKRQR